MRTVKGFRVASCVISMGMIVFSGSAMSFVSSGDGAKDSQSSFTAKLKIQKRVFRSEAPELSKKVQFSPDIRGAKIYRDKTTGELAKIEGNLGVKVDVADNNLEDFIAAAHDFVESNRVEFANLSESQLIFDASSLLFNQNEQFLTFRIERTSQLIEDSSLRFRFLKGNLVQIVANTFQKAEVIDEGDPEDSIKLLQARGLKNIASTGKVLRATANGGRVVLEPVEKFTGYLGGELYKVQVSLVNGEIFEVAPTSYHLEGHVSADIYPRWYGDEIVKTPLADLTLAAGISSDLNGMFNIEPDVELTLNGLEGTIIGIKPKTGTAVKIDMVVDDSGAAVHIPKLDVAPEGDKQVSQAMVYHHADYINKLARQYIDNSWLKSKLTANVNLSSTCNAHWDGSTINFYSADSQCANTGLISDVVYHEWGHGLDDSYSGITDGAYSEGYGDIMSLVITKSPKLGIGFLLEGHEPVRDLEEDVMYPGPESSGEVHDEGMVIGSTFWDLFKALQQAYGDEVATEKSRNFAFKMITNTDKYTEVYDALLALDDDDADLGNGTPNKCLISEVFAAHKFFEIDSACLLGELTASSFQEIDGNNNGAIDQGETIAVSLSLKNSTGVDLSDLTGEAVIVSGGDLVTIVSSQITWEKVAADETVVGVGSVQVKVNSDAGCGDEFSLKFIVTGMGKRTEIEKTFAIGRFTGVVDAQSAKDLPLEILDKETVSASISFDNDQWAADVALRKAIVKFDIDHTYIGDLTVTLVDPAGEKKQIYKGSGSADEVRFEEDLTSLLKGKNVMGEWKLEIFDRAVRDQGTLTNFSMSFTPDLFECQPH